MGLKPKSNHNNRNITAIAVLLAIAVISVGLVSCAGRRASDMVPEGDTVEVMADPAETVETDSIY